MSHIPIQLIEEPPIPNPQLTDDNIDTIKSILSKAVEAQKARQQKNNEKTAADKGTEAAIAELLESPEGVSRANLLAASESENIISLVIRIRNRLKKDNLYTLTKSGSGVSTIYCITKASIIGNIG